MDPHFLTAISPLDGRYQGKIADLREIFSESGLIKFRVLVEIRWLQTLASELPQKDIPGYNQKTKQLLDQIIDNFSLEDALTVKKIETEINHDVKAVEYFIKQKLAALADTKNLTEFIHFGCTSEDINNLAYALMIKTAREQCLLPVLKNLTQQLQHHAREYANIAMLARTHGQPASPTTLGKEFANFVARLDRQLSTLSDAVIFGKLNGASGNYNALHIAYPKINWQSVSKTFVNHLGLHWNPYTTQIEPHDYLAEIFDNLKRINVILIDFSRDMWGYVALDYFTQQMAANEVGSSTMPHKINPIDFENAEGNLGIANTLFMHMSTKLPISRWQRDLSDSTVLRNIGVAISHALLGYLALQQGIKKLHANKMRIAEDLDNHWEVLAEAIQTVMRRYHIDQPYEKLKAFTRGKPIGKNSLHQFIETLPLPDHEKKQLLSLTPDEYCGYAAELANRI